MTHNTNSGLGVAKISGADAAQFLQGQLTSDVRQLNNSWQYTGLCTPKGRLVFSGILYHCANEGSDNTEGDYYLVLNADLFAAVIKRLSMYVLRSKVDISPYPAVFELHATDSSEKVTANENRTVAQHSAPPETEQRLNFGDRALAIRYAGEQSSRAQATNFYNEWNEHLLKYGAVCIGPETSEAFVPQMINLDLVGGVSFKKGCYTGQEIVARMHYLGKLKQRMFVLSANSTNNDGAASQEPLAPGTKLFANSKQQNEQDDIGFGSSVGTVVATNADATRLLAVLRVDQCQQAIIAADAPSIELSVVKELPYEFPQSKSA